MKHFKNILVATDTRLKDHPIVNEAVAIARHTGASLKIVDVVPEFPWSVRFTLRDHKHMRELIADEKREKLESLAADVRAQGIEVEAIVLQGKTSVELIREAMRGKHDLVMRVAKAHSSKETGTFGHTGIRMLRKCPCDLLLVTGDSAEFQHIAGCVDTSSDDPLDDELNERVFDLTKSFSEYHGGSFSIVHAWQMWNWQMLKSRMEPESFDQMLQTSERTTRKQLDQFLARYGTTSEANNVHFVNGIIDEVISRFVANRKVDLVVMGTVARSGLSGMVMGNTAERIIGRLNCSVLAIKPSNFVSPIRLENETS